MQRFDYHSLVHPSDEYAFYNEYMFSDKSKPLRQFLNHSYQILSICLLDYLIFGIAFYTRL